MSDYPLDPLHAKIVLAASTQFNCVSEALTIVAMLNVPNIYIRPRNQTELADSKKS
jgi:HrpA-like RNA helicase